MRRLVETWLVLLALVLAAGAAHAGPAATPLLLDDRNERVHAWPAVTTLSDASKALTLEGAIAARDALTRPSTAAATLGLRRDAVWVHVPIAVSPESDGHWLLDINYAVLNRIDVHLLDAQGAPVQQARLGNLQPLAERPLPSRAHTVELALSPGARYELWLRVETLGAMILPISFNKPSAFLSRALAEQMLQGLLAGMGLCLVCYSLLQWFSVRESLLIKYALLIGGGILFSVVQFGIGAQYLWPGNRWLETHLAALSALTAAAGTFLFVEDVLRGTERHRWFSPVMKGGAALLGAVGLAYALDVIDVHAVSAVIGTVGLAPALMGLPGAVQRARRGESVGWYFIVAWIGYFITTAVMVAVIRGRAPATFWTLHSFQFGATLDMLIFLRVLALRLYAVHDQALLRATERDQALSLAQTDALTGLPNRRGLHAALERYLPQCGPTQLLAVYLLDLNGFKQVNDRHGHETGDHLLVAAGERLRNSLRTSDMVARLGGDEFVVLAMGLHSDERARDLAAQLTQAFDEPLVALGLPYRLGATVGHALAPRDGTDADTLLRCADAAMYAGKSRSREVVGESTTQGGSFDTAPARL
ncbi:MAG TPA: diguanylate cyclase [Methylibium sp.]|uniref:diguanylate cyclase n=1 Tax=Methylibium sp. TaxID=2067992 RepID=UPI002DBDCEBF|nr:diguanylate cyclase [Methylibium sp.]HEU4459400.1 diguanylate cyclase [Methylibium sp.]